MNLDIVRMLERDAVTQADSERVAGQMPVVCGVLEETTNPAAGEYCVLCGDSA